MGGCWGRGWRRRLCRGRLVELGVLWRWRRCAGFDGMRGGGSGGRSLWWMMMWREGGGGSIPLNKEARPSLRRSDNVIILDTRSQRVGLD